MAGPQIDRGWSEKDYLTGEALPFEGATIIRMGVRGTWTLDGQRAYHALPPSRADVRRFLRAYVEGLPAEAREDLRVAVMRLRHVPLSGVARIVTPRQQGGGYGSLKKLADEATASVVASLSRQFGCVPRYWAEWIGRV